MTGRVSMLLKQCASPDILTFSLCNKKRLAIRHTNRPHFQKTLSIPSYDIGKQVGLRTFQHPLLPISITNFPTDIRFLLLKLICNRFINIDCQDLYFPNIEIILKDSKLNVHLYDNVLQSALLNTKKLLLIIQRGKDGSTFLSRALLLLSEKFHLFACLPFW